jgi:hypothetical protein
MQEPCKPTNNYLCETPTDFFFTLYHAWNYLESPANVLYAFFVFVQDDPTSEFF